MWGDIVYNAPLVVPCHARITRGSTFKTGRTLSSTKYLPSPPYIPAIVKETLRWSLTVPFGVPHVSSADDWYEGVLIPKGTICLQNMRMTNSETDVFVIGAAQFNPARYLDESC